MPYYATLEDDLKRAREILEKGKAEVDNDDLPDAVRTWLARQGGGTIYGADIYAAYKLLESFVAAIETLQQEQRLAGDVRAILRAGQAAGARAGGQHIAGCTCILVNGEHRSTERAGCPVHPAPPAAGEV